MVCIRSFRRVECQAFIAKKKKASLPSFNLTINSCARQSHTQCFTIKYRIKAQNFTDKLKQLNNEALRTAHVRDSIVVTPLL